MLKIIEKSWGKEVVIQNVGSVRLYWNNKKQSVVIDWSINSGKEWEKKLAVQKKYGVGKVTIPCDAAKLETMIKYFNS